MENYELLHRECIASENLFVDHEFPANDSSIGNNIDGLEWKRPMELCENPKFTVKAARRSHFLQGEIGNCWFASAVSSLATCPSATTLMQTVTFEQINQGFEKHQYCGAFCFQFWQFDKWVQVIIDDQLPTVDNRLIFMHSDTGDQFLGALIEKAYAKLQGSYESLQGGHAAEAMIDLTAGWVKFLTVEQIEPSVIEEALSNGFLVVASITEDSSTKPRKLENGLTVNHGYPVIKCNKNIDREHATCLLHVWDPKDNSWQGDRLLKSQRLKSLPNSMKTDSMEKGEFWISDADFKENFTTIEICSFSIPDETDNVNSDLTMITVNGEWPAGSSDDTFYEDPQFEITIQEEQINNVSLRLELTQIGRRQYHQGKLLGIKFRIFQIDENENLPLDPDVLDEKPNMSTKTIYNKTRSFAEHFISVKPSRYLIITSTESTPETAKFVLRLSCNCKASLTRIN